MGSRKRTIKLAIEKLEARCLLAHAGPPAIVDVPDQSFTLTPADFQQTNERLAAELRRLPVDIQGKVSLDTWHAIREVEALVMDRQVFGHDGLPLSQVALQEAYGARLNDAGEVLLQFDFDALDDVALETLQQNGVRIEGVIHQYGRVLGWVHGLNIRPLGALPGVVRIDIPLLGMHRSEFQNVPMPYVAHDALMVTNEFVDSTASSASPNLRWYLLGSEDSLRPPQISAAGDEAALLDDFEHLEREVNLLAIEPTRDLESQYRNASMAIYGSQILAPAITSVFDLDIEQLLGTDAVLTVGLPGFVTRGLGNAS